MAMSVVVHMVGEDAFVGEIDELPDPTHHYVLLRNIRKRDGKELGYVTMGATAFLFPWHRITFLETMGEVPVAPGITANGAQATQILGFFREDDRDR
jgi:hypothetical protein